MRQDRSRSLGGALRYRMSPGIPDGSVSFVMEVLDRGPGPIRRRLILEELERRGHRISLAGLNRILQVCQQQGLTIEGPDGVRRRPGSPRT